MNVASRYKMTSLSLRMRLLDLKRLLCTLFDGQRGEMRIEINPHILQRAEERGVNHENL
jgi:hypothetical protein